MISSLEGRVALVTGCTGGIGRSICAALGEVGATVIGADLPADGGNADVGGADVGDWADGIAKSDYHQLDVTSEESWDKVMSAVEADHGRLDVLVHVAGIVVVDKLETTSLADWRRQMAVNVDGVFIGTKRAISLMKRTGENLPHGASIVNISSIAGLNGAALHTGYCASKAAVNLFTKAAALEFSALKYKVRVNSIHPSGVKTGMVDHIFQRFVDCGFAESVEQVAAGMGPAHPIGRLADPIDVAKAVRFLASDESGYCHGSSLIVDGGYTAQ